MTTLPFIRPGDIPDFLTGALVLVDKPAGWTSFDVVNKIRSALRGATGKKNIKVGHSGTLDPMATGLLLICTGGWTKQLHGLQGLDKRYVAQITLGIATDTYDAEGGEISRAEVPLLDAAILERHLIPFQGEISQYPPAFSAIKKDGKPLYALARAGKEVKLEPRRVVVHELRLLEYAAPTLILEIHCGSGFYVRSLAHDLGQTLGCGAHLSALRRTTVGTYSLVDAWTVEALTALIREM